MIYWQRPAQGNGHVGTSMLIVAIGGWRVEIQQNITVER